MSNSTFQRRRDESTEVQFTEGHFLPVEVSSLVNEDGTTTPMFWTLWNKRGRRGHLNKDDMRMEGLAPSKDAAGRWVVAGLVP